MPLNKVIIIGNLGKDPETRYTANGKTVANFSVAVSEKYKEETSTEWFSVVAWERLAELAKNYLHKGNVVYIEGRQKTREYEKDGAKHRAVDLVASQIVLLPNGQRAQSDHRESGDDSGDDIPF